ncbi:MAG: hypothetical protein KGY55_03010, partial [Candidatus Thermoplasmatota archaeon]|nr:hypothetical protein [Candidatus Thermoplasmatota archaeon]
MIVCVTLALILGTFSQSLSGGDISTTEKPMTPGEDRALELEAFNEDTGTPHRYDTRSPTGEAATLAADQNDIGYHTDAGNSVYSSLPVYIGEHVDSTTPGRGRTGSLAPDDRDDSDWYLFSACEGQQVDVSLTTDMDYSVELANTNAEVVARPYTVETTGTHFIRIFAAEGAGAGDYTFSITTGSQYDGGMNGDAGNTRAEARAIEPGDHCGYMCETDREDWYSFQAGTGDGIFITLQSPQKSDYDVTLYNPSGEAVHAAHYYGDDELEYPADATGTWTMQIHMFPGWDEEKWPDDYFRYGCGGYTFTLDVGGTAQAPPEPRAQPDIIPVAQTFVVNNDDNGNTDEYGYLAAIPAANYLDGGQRHLSPIVYQGVGRQINWYGTVDDTTGYLLDDWNTYLDRHGMTAEEYVVPDDPVQAAADIATSQWDSAGTAVIAVDGSSFADEATAAIDTDATLNVETQVTTAPQGSSQLKDVGGRQALPMFLGSKWAAMTVYASPTSPAMGIITPRYELGTEEDWPHPYDAAGDNTNIYFPITMPGLWFPYAGSDSGDWTLEVTKYSGDRYKVPVDDTSSSLEVTVTTDEASTLEVFLVDPHGNIRRPSVPHWNDPTYENINPLHQWNGDHHNGFEGWRRWEPVASTEHSVEVHYPMEGKWTVIVAPHYPYGEEKTSDSIDYHITANVRQHSGQRTNAALSAANGAVLASLNHAPLLYVTADEVPAATQQALDSLSVSNIIFVNLGEISSADVGADTTYTSMQAVVDAVKANTASENYITVTSLGSGDGYSQIGRA